MVCWTTTEKLLTVAEIPGEHPEWAQGEAVLARLWLPTGSMWPPRWPQRRDEKAREPMRKIRESPMPLTSKNVECVAFGDVLRVQGCRLSFGGLVGPVAAVDLGAFSAAGQEIKPTCISRPQM